MIVTASAAELCIVPDPRTMIEKAAPKAAALEIPNVNGEPNGLRSTACMATPASDSPPPASMAARVWGRRIFTTITLPRPPPPPRRTSITSETGILTAPQATDSRPRSKQSPPNPRRKSFLRPT